MNEIEFEQISEAQFEGRTPGGAMRVKSVQATLRGAYTLLERAVHDDPADSTGNLKCAAAWLQQAVITLQVLAQERENVVS